MADLNVLLAKASDRTQVATGNANAAVTATVAAPSDTSMAIYVTGITVSVGAAPSTPVSVTLTEDAGVANTLRGQYEFPAAQFLPFEANYQRPLRIAPGKNVALSIPAVGGTTRATAVVRYFLASA